MFLLLVYSGLRFILSYLGSNIFIIVLLFAIGIWLTNRSTIVQLLMGFKSGLTDSQILRILH